MLLFIDIFEAEIHAASFPSTSTMNVSVVSTTTTPRGSENNSELEAQSDITTTETTHSSGLTDDEQLCAEFVARTCGCKKGDGRKPCSSLFPVQHYVDIRAQAALLTRNELDMVLLGSVMSTVLDSSHAVEDHSHRNAKRRRICSNYMHNGYNVCKNTFAFLHGIGVNHRLQAIRRHYTDNGLETRVHQNTKRLPVKTLTYDDIKCIIQFLQNYAEQHAILLPGRIPGYKRDDVKLLPSSNSKMVSCDMHTCVCS